MQSSTDILQKCNFILQSNEFCRLQKIYLPANVFNKLLAKYFVIKIKTCFAFDRVKNDSRVLSSKLFPEVANWRRGIFFMNRKLCKTVN